MSSNVISVYSREQAIKDGVLVDMTEESRYAGFTGKVPMAISAALSAEINSPTNKNTPEESLANVLLAAFQVVRRAMRLDGDNSILKITSVYGMPSVTREDPLWLCFNEYEGFTLMFPSDY